MSEITGTALESMRLAAIIRDLVADVPEEALSSLSEWDSLRLKMVSNAPAEFRRTRGRMNPVGMSMIEECLRASVDILGQLPLSPEASAKLAVIRECLEVDSAQRDAHDPPHSMSESTSAREGTVH